MGINGTGRFTYTWRIVGSVGGAEYEFIAVRSCGVRERFCGIATALLDEGQAGGWVDRLLASFVRLLVRGVDVRVKCAFEVGLLAEHEIKQLVIEFIIKVGEHWSTEDIRPDKQLME